MQKLTFFFYFDFLSSLSLSLVFLFFTPCFGIFIPRIIFLLVRAVLNSVIPDIDSLNYPIFCLPSLVSVEKRGNSVTFSFSLPV